MRLANRIALITGGSRGIGRGIALGYAREGADVLVHYNAHGERADEVVQLIRKMGRNAASLRTDLGSPGEIPAFIEKAWGVFGKIDILVNNAGIADFCDFFKLSFSQWRRVLTINLDSVMLCCQEIAQRMIKRGIHGKIINVSSVNGFQVERQHVDYNVSKAGLDMLTKSLAVEFGPFGINVNGLAPDIVKTEIVPEEFWEKQGERFRNKTPIGRKAEVADCVGPAIFLASDEAIYIQGHTLVLDGGMTLTQL